MKVLYPKKEPRKEPVKVLDCDLSPKRPIEIYFEEPLRSTPRAPVRWLASPHTSLRGELLAKWVKFFQSLRSSSSPGVATIARVSARELRTTSGGNHQSEPDSEHRHLGRGLGEDAQEQAQGNQGADSHARAAAPGAVYQL